MPLKKDLASLGVGHAAKSVASCKAHSAYSTPLISRRDGAGGFQPTRRYKGPYVSELSMDSLRQSPKPWPAFFMGEHGGTSRAAYNLPADTTMLLDRLEENLVFFLVRRGPVSESTEQDDK